MTNQFNLPAQFPVLPTRSAVLLPGVRASLEVGRNASVQAVDAAEREDKFLIVVPQRDPEVVTPTPANLHNIGVIAEVIRVEKNGPRRYTVTLQARTRCVIETFVSTHPYLAARGGPLPPQRNVDESALEALMESVKIPMTAIIASSTEPDEITSIEVMELDDPEELLGLVAAHIELQREQEIALLTEENPIARLRLVLPILTRLHEVLLVKASIDEQLSGDISRGERERVLRDRMRAIKEELGEADADNDIDEYRRRIDESSMPDEVRQAVMRQMGRMSHMASSSPEYNVARTYVETLLDIPWGVFTEDTIDVAGARAILEADHAGLEKVKKRILEFIAVRKLAPDKHGPILCLVGPPGVGKTSLGRSIAAALNRKYVRTALGGVRDESAIRGHRRTYIGALPGRIASSLKKAGAMNPVFVLDEIDKLGSDHRGDPSSALLEVLDPEQNRAFSDHYLEVDLDLSKVMFLATANELETIPPPLLDRMEVIRVPGYTVEEKREIAKKHLWPKQIVEHGLERDRVTIDDEAIIEVIVHYTREAGVRNLERELAALCRHAAVEIASGHAEIAHVTRDSLADTLGPPSFHSEIADRHPEVGICTGLAWTPTGGDIIFIEARSMPGKGHLKLTGQLGDIMSESATAAFSWVRANADRLKIDSKELSSLDIHMHIPAGGVRKDGPSAGVAISTALVSLLSDTPVRNDVAITGEISLRGLSLPVGGIKEKVLAAHRAGIKMVLLPERNRKDLEDIPKEIQEDLDIRFIKRVDEALDIALGRPTEDSPVMPMVPPSAAKSGPTDQIVTT
jgi:ATP-dependent Lon protease